MKKAWLILLTGFILCGCDDFLTAPNTARLTDGAVESAGFTKESTDTEDQSIWVCYHPGTDYHNERCVEEEYPLGCYVEGDRHKFCWLLEKQDCLEDNKSEQLEACQLFSKP